MPTEFQPEPSETPEERLLRAIFGDAPVEQARKRYRSGGVMGSMGSVGGATAVAADETSEIEQRAAQLVIEREVDAMLRTLDDFIARLKRQNDLIEQI